MSMRGAALLLIVAGCFPCLGRGSPGGVEEILTRFDGEPTVRQVQRAALRHAEIRPDEIQRWRSTVRTRALVPELALSLDHDRGEDADWQRRDKISISGGTVTVGPDEITEGRDTDRSWSVGVSLSWDLEEYVFHRDQLRITQQAEDLVLFRMEVLDRVTERYFERRRLQAELALLDLEGREPGLEALVRLAELTAELDGLTGGWFGRALTATEAP